MLALAKSQEVELRVSKVTPPFYTPRRWSYGSLAGTRTDWDRVVQTFWCSEKMTAFMEKARWHTNDKYWH